MSIGFENLDRIPNKIEKDIKKPPSLKQGRAEKGKCQIYHMASIKSIRSHQLTAPYIKNIRVCLALWQERLDPFQHFGDIDAGRVADSRAVDIGNIGVDRQDGFSAAQQVRSAGVAEAGAA